MGSVLAMVITTLAKELLVPLVKGLLAHIVDSGTKGTGITDDDYNDIIDLMSESSHNSKGN